MMEGRDALVLTGLAAGALMLWRGRGQQELFSFRGKVVLVTGGSRGLGLVLARRLAQEGARVAILARDRDELDRAGAELAGRGMEPLTLPADVTDPSQVEDAVRAVEVHLGPVDVLINNAGIVTVGPMETMTREDYEESLAIHFWGPYNTVQAVLPSMRARQTGRIVNIASVGGQVSVPHLLPYSTSKYALVGYSRGLRAELAGDGITVTTVCPGLMRTGSPRNAYFKGKAEAEYAWFSISDSLPGVSTSAEKAAIQILDACRRGEAEIVLTLPARMAVAAQVLFPELMATLLEMASQLLPGPDGRGTAAKPGRESESLLAPSALTAPTEAAALRNNEIAPEEF